MPSTEPPPSFPTMTVNGGQPVDNGGVVTVTIGDRLVVRCRVDGGFLVATVTSLSKKPVVAATSPMASAFLFCNALYCSF